MNKYLFLLLITLPFLSFSQTKVSGVVNDEFGEPIAYANVVFKDSYEGTITNEMGRFYLESDKNYTSVVFSFVGYGSLFLMMYMQNDLRFYLHPKMNIFILIATGVFFALSISTIISENPKRLLAFV